MGVVAVYVSNMKPKMSNATLAPPVNPMDALVSLDEVKTLEAASLQALQALQSAEEDVAEPEAVGGEPEAVGGEPEAVGGEPEAVSGEPEAVSDEVDYTSMTVAQLKDHLREAGKTVSGKKAELIERLQE
jgi:hypothetical protein